MLRVLVALAVVLTGLVAGPAPAGAARGSAEAWAPLLTNAEGPLHWQPCRTITYRVDEPIYAAELREAMSRVERRTALTFTPSAPGEPADLVITFKRTAEDPALRDATAYAWVDPPGFVEDGWYFTHATVTVDKQVLSHFKIWWRRSVLMHELGHAVGLDHVSDPDQVMYGGDTHQRTWGAGDLAGLAALYSPAGCPVS